MTASNVQFLWRDPAATRFFGTGVCLHGHTLHSRECLSFLPRYMSPVPGLAGRAQATVDFSRAFWTPPFTPAAALRLERRQISGLGLLPMVSLTDHDNIAAGLSLQLAADRRETPVSVEWTVPYQATYIHLGIHNMPPHCDRAWMAAMSAYTDDADHLRLPELLAAFAAVPDVLIVLNHPFWLEEGVRQVDHDRALERLLRQSIDWIHAFELNGTRTWTENAAVMALARAHSRPVISGGDRHAGEPAACINLTNSRTFSAFVSEIRDGHSNVAFLPHYREPMSRRILQTGWDVLRPYPEYPGRERWIDRIYYCEEPLSAIWKDQVPWMLTAAVKMVELAATTRLRLLFQAQSSPLDDHS